MLVQHKDEVCEYLKEKKDAFVDPGDETSVDENAQEQLRSPPLPAAGLRSPLQGSMRSNGNGESIKLPPIGHFSVGNSARNSPHLAPNSPTTPGSPLKSGIARN